ncbi:hypothetical protein THH46_12050 [Pseudomonas sp. NA13]
MTGPQFLSAVDTLDQAAGLRRWARQNQAAPLRRSERSNGYRQRRQIEP